MVAVRLENVTKRFGTVTAVDNITLDIAEGELFFLLGPSGCGKTTILRTIAGFEHPDAGAVSFDGRDITLLPPHKRNTGMVFQNYALWPHMSVFQNVAYGLAVRKLPMGDIARSVSEALEMVRMAPQRDRYPNQLSGGQQQRVALARALVINPGCLLLDEPLSNLDAKLRLEMRDEIRRIHAETGVTTIYVTHDQKEALSMAVQLAVICDGRVVQTGRPEEIYRRPANAFVAAFVGETNLIDGTIARIDGNIATVASTLGNIFGTLTSAENVVRGQACTVSIRPEDIVMADSARGENTVPADLVQYTFLGDIGQYVFKAGPYELKALTMAPTGREGLHYLSFPRERVLVFPSENTSTGGGNAA